MKAVASSFDADTKAKEKNAKTAEILNKQIETQKERIRLLTEMYQKSAQELGENDTKTLKWKEALNNATASLNSMEKDLKDTEQGIKSEGDAAEKAAERHQKLVSGLKAAGAAFAAVAAAAGAAAIKLGKAVVESFGELEQNLGGSEAVFGQYAESIQKAAEDAYRTMGTSQSDYLATANKIGALFQGSGIEQQRSLELTTQAMQRAADMASVMGIDTQTALDAITGAAKGNFAMMDNIGIAMNATTLEAYALSKGITTAYKSMSNSQKAELAMQYFFEKTAQYEGNFAKEATSTVTGSLGLLSASWKSFIAGLGNEKADINNLTNNIVDAFQAVVKNIKPVIENIVNALPTAFNAMSEMLIEMLPSLLSTVMGLFDSVLDMLVKSLPELIPVAVSAVLTITNTLVDNLPTLVNGALMLVVALAQGFADNVDELTPAVVDAVITVVTTLINNIDLVIGAGLDLIDGLITGIINAIPNIIAALPKVITAIIDKFKSTDWASIGKNIMEGIKKGISSMISNLVAAVKDVANNLINAAKRVLGISSPSKVFANEIGKYIPEGITLGIDRNVPAMLRDAREQFGMLSAALPARAIGSTQNYGGFTINVNAAPGQDAKEIADMVMLRIQSAVSRKEAVFA